MEKKIAALIGILALFLVLNVVTDGHALLIFFIAFVAYFAYKYK